MTTQIDTRDLYHAVRRAGTQHYVVTVTGEHRVCQATTYTDLRKAAVPRGCGPARDDIARDLAALRSKVAGKPSPLIDRLHACIVAIYSEVIEDRGGETTIEERAQSVSLHVMDRSRDLTLLGCDGWRQYSRRFGARPASLRYLCGRDDNGRWAVRVPSTCDSVGDVVRFVEPADVQRARADGRRILRQGDVYLVEQRIDNFDAVAGTRHRWDAATRTLHHDDPQAPHAGLHVPFRARASVQSVLRMGRVNGRRRGD